MAKKYRHSHFSIDMEATGRRLRDFRNSRRLTIAELSEKTGLSIGMISETEAGKNKPSPNLMLGLYQLYGLNINWLLTGEGSMKVRGKLFEPPKDEKGEPTYDMDMLTWYMDRIPMVKYAILGFFASYFFDNRAYIEKILRGETGEKISEKE